MTLNKIQFSFQVKMFAFVKAEWILNIFVALQLVMSVLKYFSL